MYHSNFRGKKIMQETFFCFLSKEMHIWCQSFDAVRQHVKWHARRHSNEPCNRAWHTLLSGVVCTRDSKFIFSVNPQRLFLGLHLLLAVWRPGEAHFGPSDPARLLQLYGTWQHTSSYGWPEQGSQRKCTMCLTTVSGSFVAYVNFITGWRQCSWNLKRILQMPLLLFSRVNPREPCSKLTSTVVPAPQDGKLA